MFHIHDHDKFNSEEDIIKCMKSMFLDSEYKIEHSWKMCFMHPYQYLEHPVYKEKREDMQNNGHSITESLGFLLFPATYGINSYVPVLNHDFIITLQMSKSCPDQTLGKCSDGVSLFKSVDVLLKFAAMKRVKCPRIAVYKFMEGRNKTRLCELDEDLGDIEPPDPKFDSFSLDLCFGDDLETRDLKQQLRFSEIFLYDMKTKGEVTVTRSSPRQINPVTMICFLPLRPFIVPRPIVQRPKRKRRLLPKRDASRGTTPNHLVGNTSAESECLRTSQCTVCSKSHTYHAETGEALFTEESPCSPVTQTSPLSCSSQPAEAQGPAIDVLGQAVFSAGLVDHDPMFCSQASDQINVSQAEKVSASHANDVDDFLSSLQNKSLETLCREVGLDSIICGEGALETPQENEDVPMAQPQPLAPCTAVAAAIPDARTALNDNDTNVSVNIESLSATIQFNSSFQNRIDELLAGQTRPIPECLISATKTTLRRSPRINSRAVVPREISGGGLKLDLDNVNDGNIFDILNHLLAEKADTQVTDSSSSEVDQNNNNTRMLCDKTPSNSSRVVQQAPFPLAQSQVALQARSSPNTGRNFVKQPPKPLSRLVLNTPPLSCTVSLPSTPLSLQSDLQVLSPSQSSMPNVVEKKSGETEANGEARVIASSPPKEIVKKGRGRPKKRVRGKPVKRKLSEPRKDSESDAKEQCPTNKASPLRITPKMLSAQKQQQQDAYDYLSSEMLHNAAQKRRTERIDYAKLAKRFSRRIRPEYQQSDRVIAQRCVGEPRNQKREKRVTNAVQHSRSFGHRFLQVVNRKRAMACVAALLFDQTPSKQRKLASPKAARTSSTFSTPSKRESSPKRSCSKQAFTSHTTSPDIAAILDTSPDKEPHNLVSQASDVANTISCAGRSPLLAPTTAEDRTGNLSDNSDNPLLCILSAGDSAADDAADCRQHLFSPSPSPSIASRSVNEKMTHRNGSLGGKIDFSDSFASTSSDINALHSEAEIHLEIVKESLCRQTDRATKDRTPSPFACDSLAKSPRRRDAAHCHVSHIDNDRSPKTSDHKRHPGSTPTNMAHALPRSVNVLQSDGTDDETHENPRDDRKTSQGSESIKQEKCEATNVTEEAAHRKDNPECASAKSGEVTLNTRKKPPKDTQANVSEKAARRKDNTISASGKSGKVILNTRKTPRKDTQHEQTTGDFLSTAPKSTQESLSEVPVIQILVNPPLVSSTSPTNISTIQQQLQSIEYPSCHQHQQAVMNSSLDRSWRNNSTSSDFGSAPSSAGGSTSTVLRKRRKMFHGRPLLMRKYNLPRVIHLESVGHPAAKDPRIANDMSRLELTPIDPACWQNVDSGFQRFQVPANSPPNCNISANVSCWSPTCRRLIPDSDSEIAAKPNARSPPFKPSNGGKSTSSLASEIAHSNNDSTSISANSKEANKRPQTASQQPMSAASKFRVSLLLDAEDVGPVFSDEDNEHDDVGSFYACEGGDAIELGASPRDYFPDCSSDDGESILTGLGRSKGFAQASNTGIAASNTTQKKSNTSAEKLFALLDENKKLYYDRLDLAREKANKSVVERPLYRRSLNRTMQADECFKDYVNHYAWLNSCQPSDRLPARPASAHEPHRRASVGGGLRGICGFFKNPK